jgi:hypothetical protein
MYILVKNGCKSDFNVAKSSDLCIIYRAWMTKPPLIILATASRRAMKVTRFSEEQIIGVLCEYEVGAKTEKVCRRYGISSATF